MMAAILRGAKPELETYQYRTVIGFSTSARAYHWLSRTGQSAVAVFGTALIEASPGETCQDGVSAVRVRSIDDMPRIAGGVLRCRSV